MKILFPIIIFFSLIYPDEWGSTGHRVIAEVADNYQTDNSRVKILDILEGMKWI